MERYSEEEIINGCKKNNRIFQERLYKRFFPKMFAACLKHTNDRDEALLIVNDGFLKVFKNINKFEARGSFEGWVRRIVLNSIYDYYRKHKKYLEKIVFDENINTVSEESIQELYMEDLELIIDSLPPATSRVFRLYSMGFTHKEIGVKLNISEGTSKWHYSTARKSLQEKLKNEMH